MHALVLLTAFTAATPAAEQAASPDDSAFFESKIRPLLVKRCHECHSTQSKKQRGGLALDARAAILQGGDSGPAVVPGKPEQSRLIRAVRYGAEDLRMPPKGKLPAGEIGLLEEWVRRGVPFPGTTATASRRMINLAEGRKFWSFRPPRQVAPPKVQQAAWPRRRIDTFLLAEMEKRGLAPSPPASPRTLVRRLAFDLTGLPPTPEEIDTFVKDTAADAYERLVERFLASPNHGERWSRFWLDLVRYRDIGESWTEIKSPAWLYRDWVAKAFNEDLPYDTFVQKQLAADLIPGAVPEDKVSLGFLGLSPDYWKELRLDPAVIKTIVAEEWEERIGALGATFLGLTLACARCHDHKFDPITQQDYYALAGVFSNIKVTDEPLLPEPRAASVRLAHAKVRVLESDIGIVTETEQATPKRSRKIADMKAQIEALRMTANFNSPAAAAVEDAALLVLPDGTDRTKLVYLRDKAQDVAVQVRGDPSRPGPVVPRRFVSVLSSESPRPFTHGSGRLELARALVTEGAPLTARVIVNRVWKHHFGTALVDTMSDFGAQGSRPTHPELLDDLTARFMAAGWSLKWLHREIVHSAAYRQSSAPDARQEALDPDNRWLWRANRRRLEVEAWRDAMLAVAGVLDRRMGGPSIDLGDPKNFRRTLYGIVKRYDLADLLRLFDFPDPVVHSPGRVPTTTALQGLFVLNSHFVQQQSAAVVERLHRQIGSADVKARVRQAYRLLFGREPTASQVELAGQFLGQATDQASSQVAWREYVQVLLGSNEFLFVD